MALRGKGSAIHLFFIYSHSTDGTQSYATTGDPRAAKETISRPRARCRCPASFRAQNSNSEFPFAPNHWLYLSLFVYLSLLPVSVLSVLVASPLIPTPLSFLPPFPPSPLPRFPFNGAQIYLTRSRRARSLSSQFLSCRSSQVAVAPKRLRPEQIRRRVCVQPKKKS